MGHKGRAGGQGPMGGSGCPPRLGRQGSGVAEAVRQAAGVARSGGPCHWRSASLTTRQAAALRPCRKHWCGLRAGGGKAEYAPRRDEDDGREMQGRDRLVRAMDACRPSFVTVVTPAHVAA